MAYSHVQYLEFVKQGLKIPEYFEETLNLSAMQIWRGCLPVYHLSISAHVYRLAGSLIGEPSYVEANLWRPDDETIKYSYRLLGGQQASAIREDEE